MEVPSAALSIHSLVSSVGADVGFAALVAVAIMALLYFAQARETATLRERLEDAHARIGTLEGRVTQLIRAQSARQVPLDVMRASAARPPVTPPPVAPPVITPPPRVRPMGSALAAVKRATSATTVQELEPPAPAAYPGAPFGVAAPALASATKLIPDPVTSLPPVHNPFHPRLAEPAAAVAPATVAGNQRAVASASVAGNQRAVAPASVAGSERAAAPTSVMRSEDTVGAAAVADDGRVPVGARREHESNLPAEAASERDAPLAVGADAQAPPPVQIRTGQAKLNLREPHAGAKDIVSDVDGARRSGDQPPFTLLGDGRGVHGAGGASRRGRGLPLAIALLAVVVIAIGAYVITSHSSSGPVPVSHARAGVVNGPRAHHHRGAAAAPFSPASVSVAVLNGTNVPGLAADVGRALRGKGYHKGSITNAAAQSQARTIVYYRPGYRAAAGHVAAALKLHHARLARAGHVVLHACATTPAGARSKCGGNVIVSVGHNLAGMAAATPPAP